MKHGNNLTIGVSVLALSALAWGAAGPTPDKYTLKVQGGLAFSEFRGYEKW